MTLPAARNLNRSMLLLIAGLAIAAPGYAAGEAAHEHASGNHRLTLDHGRKWKTDEPLRKGMENIRAAMAADLKAIHANKESPPQYDALAARVNGEVATIVQNCKLEPRADAELHKLIAELMAGTEAMQGKEKGVSRRAGAERVASALGQYGKFFEHPGWRRL